MSVIFANLRWAWQQRGYELSKNFCFFQTRSNLWCFENRIDPNGKWILRFFYFGFRVSKDNFSASRVAKQIATRAKWSTLDLWRHNWIFDIIEFYKGFIFYLFLVRSKLYYFRFILTFDCGYSHISFSNVLRFKCHNSFW